MQSFFAQIIKNTRNIAFLWQVIIPEPNINSQIGFCWLWILWARFTGEKKGDILEFVKPQNTNSR